MAEKYKELTRQVSSGKYSGTEAGDRILGAMMALSPQTSTDAMALLIPLAYCSLFTNAGISIDPNKITRSCPSSTTLKEFVTKAAADSKYLALSKINNIDQTGIYACGASQMINSAKAKFFEAGLKESNFYSDPFVQSF